MPSSEGISEGTVAPARRLRSLRSAFRGVPRRWIVGPGLLLAMSCGFCWSLLFTNHYTWIDDPDLVNMDVPRLQVQATAWHDHEFPLWDSHLWCGQPFLGEIVGAAFPLNWPLFFFRPHGKGQVTLGELNWYFFLLHFLGAFSAYCLCRELRMSLLASVLGGFVYSFGGYFVVTRWPEVMGGLSIGPLVLLFLLRVLARERPYPNAALAGMFLGLTWLGGHHEFPTYLSLAVATIFIYDFFCHPSKWHQALGLASMFLLFTVLASGLQIVPAFEYARLAVRWVGLDQPVGLGQAVPYQIHEAYSLTPSSLLGMLVPWAGQYAGLFTGIVALSLALVGVVAGWQSRPVRLFTCIGLGGLLLSMGRWNLFHGVLYALLPMFEKARSPNRLISLFSLGIAVLAAFGLDYLRSGACSSAVRRVCLIGAGLAGFIFALALAAQAFQKGGPNDYVLMLALIGALFSAVTLACQNRKISTRALGVALLALAFIELGNVGARLYVERTPEHRESFLPRLAEYHDVADFLRAQPGLARIDATAVAGAFNLGDWEGIDTLNGFGAGVTKNIFSLDWPSVRTQNLLAVNYALSKQPPRPDQQIVFHSAGGLDVLRNTEALPRVRIVHRIDPVVSVEEASRRIQDPAFDAATTGLVVGSAPAVEACAGDEAASVSKRTTNSVTVNTTLSCRGMLILADTWYPGWTANVDGRSATIYKAYGALRGVVLDGGAHVVKFRYRPMSALIGALMSLTGVFGACALAAWDRLRSPLQPA